RLAPLITHRFPFSRYADAYRFIDEHRETTLKVLIDL
ncbi:MAG TPA: Zn-dependent alcohol dehydrogenase, partial [Clostridia bacterium]|nr:Zn-dependent alcohol dehydrogenase [Clostridia bacterium]